MRVVSARVRAIVLTALVVVSASAFAAFSTHLNRRQLWFSNLDQDSVLLLNSIRVNEGRAPDFFGHPSQGVYIIYGRLLEVFQALGATPVAHMSELERAPDPILLVPRVFYAGRAASIVVSLLCALCGAAAIAIFTRRLDHGLLGALILLASPGLLFQSLLVRSELASMLFLVVSLLALTRFLMRPRLPLVLFAGMAFGLAYATKIHVLPFAAVVTLMTSVALQAPAWNWAEWRTRLPDGIRSASLVSALCLLGGALIWKLQLLWSVEAAYLMLTGRGVPGAAAAAALLLPVAALAIGVRRVPVRSGASTQVVAAALLLAGFFFGIVSSLGLSSILGDDSAIAMTNARLFTYAAMTEYSNAGNAVMTGQTPDVLSSLKAIVLQCLAFLRVYLFETFSLSGYVAALVLAHRKRALTNRGLWASLSLTATGLLFMLVSSLRHYGEHYWVYIDGFFLAAFALVVSDLLDRFPTLRASALAIVAAAVLSAAQYVAVARAYPQFNFALRDKLDSAGKAFFEVGDYSSLMTARYGTRVQFMQRVLDDPALNGADRGIDIRASHGVALALRKYPELRLTPAPQPLD